MVTRYIVFIILIVVKIIGLAMLGVVIFEWYEIR